jgi:hypothetical protein
MAAERADIVIPDYAATLDSIGPRIAAAAESARRSDQDRISQARSDLHNATQEVRSIAAHAR